MLCGGLLLQEWVEGKLRPRCGACRFVVFENPAAVSAAVVIDPEGRVLLVQRALEPQRGCWALPAGYQDLGEEPWRAAEREAFEETGLTVEAVALLDLVHVLDAIKKNANVAVYLCRWVAGQVVAGDDASAAGFFALDGLPEPMGFENRQRILDKLPLHPTYLKWVDQLRRLAPSNAKDQGIS